MKLIRLSVLVGLITAIPLCMLIYVGVDRLEKSAGAFAELQDAFEDFGFFAIEPQFRSTYPLERTLSNHSGTKLRVLIIGRTPDALQFFSHTHNQVFTYLIGNLSSDDQAFAETLPVEIAPEEGYPTPRILRTSTGSEKVVMVEGRTQFDVFYRDLKGQNIEKDSIQSFSRDDRQFLFGLPINR